MSEYKIEKGVPIPPARHGRKYPWHEMEIGDSFVVPDMSKSHAGAVCGGARKNGRKFSFRLLETGGVRIWRVE